MGVALGPMADGVTRRIPHGVVIVRQGEDVDCLFLVTEGAVRLASVTAAGREIVVAVLGVGEIFGESALLRASSPVEARAIGRTEVVALRVSAIRHIVERAPGAAEQLLRLVAGRLHRTQSVLEEALTLDVAARLVGRLRELATDHGIPDVEGLVVPIPLTQEELARMLGVTRETVNRTVGPLISKGLVRSRRRWLVLPDPEALEAELRAPA